jgi:6-phosphogluconate dehydrogenase
MSTPRGDNGLCDIGLIGLAVMGKNLVLNIEDHGYSVAVYNRTVQRVDEFVAENPGRKIHGARSIEDLCAHLKKPRKVILLVKAGPPVDDFIEHLVPHLEAKDIVIDAGNSHFPDTIRRTRDLEARGLRFIGTGVSGGEEGARYGPSIMPGGSPSAWPEVKEILQAIAAKVGPDDTPCCDWVGSDGAGHYVKMVHNGIEYGDMQLICEAYFLMKESLGMSAQEMHQVFAHWNKGDLQSYLIEITRDILAVEDEVTRKPLVEMILDTAGQKGTGVWTSQSALALGIPAPTIVEAVLARAISAQKAERVAASRQLRGPSAGLSGGRSAAERDDLVDAIEKALYCSKICSYAQGFALIRAAAEEYGWDLDYGSIALLWRGGCIIRAVFLERIRDAFAQNPGLKNLLLDPFFKEAIHRNQDAWRRVVSQAIQLGIPTPAFGSALAYYDSYRRATLPANLLQAQRDYFGAHTYRRVDAPADAEPVHTDWVGITRKLQAAKRR